MRSLLAIFIFLITVTSAAMVRACELCAEAVVVDQSTLPCMIAALEEAKDREPSRPRYLIDVSDCTTIDPETRSVVPAFPKEGRRLTSRFVIETRRIDCLIFLLENQVDKKSPNMPVSISISDEACKKI